MTQITDRVAAAANWRRHEHTMVDVDGIRHHVVRAGDGPVIVLVAGFPQSCYAWRHLLPLLARDFTVLAVDLPGQGDSDKPADGYDTHTTAHRVHRLLDVLGHSRYTLVGHDVGAWVGYSFAHAFADRLNGLVLVDGNIPGVTLPTTLALAPDNWRNWHFLFNAVPDLPEALLGGRERVLIEWFFRGKAASAQATFTTADIDEYERVYAMPGGLRGMLGYYRAVLTDIDQNAELMKRQLQVPILALGGELGSAPDLFERMRPLGAHVQGGMISGSGHYIPEEQPEALAERITAFLAQLPDYQRA